jgi:hypothetical protein
MPRIEATNDYERRLLDNVKVHGWQCTSVGAGDDEPCFSYTIGLFKSFSFPELMIVGLSSVASHSILTIAANAAREGKPLNVEEPTDALVEGYSCVFVKVPESKYADYVSSASWYYNGYDFPLYQVVLPSKAALFPWHPRAGEEFRSAQPVIGVHHGAA